MVEASGSQVLVTATLLSTFHLCVGIWIGSVLGRRVGDGVAHERGLAEGLDQAVTYTRRQLDRLGVLSKQAQSFSAKCLSSDTELPASFLRTMSQLTHAIDRIHQQVCKDSASLDAQTVALKREPPQPKRHETLSAIPQMPASEAQRLTEQELLQLTKVEHSANVESDEKRYPYVGRQYLAPYRNGVFPPASEFGLVRCKDIASQGLSYFADEQPEYEFAIIALGAHPNLTFMVMEIVYSRLVYMYGKTWYRVGCRFVKRIEAPGVVLGEPEPQALEAVGA